MTSQYTDAELKAIANAPMLVSLAISLVDLGVVSTAMEAVAMSKQFTTAAQKYPNNSIIQAAFSEESLKSGVIRPEKPEVTAEEVESGAFVQRAINSVNETITLLGDKTTPEEIQEYKQFIYACAQAVAEAAGPGLFGSGTPKISDKEGVALSRVKTALGV